MNRSSHQKFGHFILFEKLESDPIEEVWRAGRIEGNTIGSVVALHRFNLDGIDQNAFFEALTQPRAVAPSITGTAFVKQQGIDAIDGIPYLEHQYATGRTLRHIIEKARSGQSPNPIPIEQALGIAERLAQSLETLSNLRYQSARLVHGALLPQFVWISDDGEVRTAGQQFGRALFVMMKKEAVEKEVAPFLAPEYRGSGEATKVADVYSLGALLFMMLTGGEPPDSLLPGAAERALAEATLLGRAEAIPADLQSLLQRSLNFEPSKRFPSAAEMRQSLSPLLTGGKYSPTTFNLAFYLHNLLKKEFETETRQAELESSVVPSTIETAVRSVPTAAAKPVPVLPPLPPRPPFAPSEPEVKNRLPLIVAASLVAAIASAVGIYFAFTGKESTPVPPAAVVAPAVTATTATMQTSEPIVAALPPGTTPAAPQAEASMSEAERKKAREAAINKKLQEELLKLQLEYNRGLKPAAQPAAAAIAARNTPTRVAPREESAPSAAQLDAQRRQQNESVALPPPPVAVPVATANAPQQSQPDPTPLATPQIREGDLIEITQLDSIPELTAPVRPVYPPLALRQKIEGMVILSALVAETGRVLDVRILRGDKRRMGLDEAAVKAVRNAIFSPGVKDGKRVRTWKPIPVIFKLQ